ncbi:UNVERIFIED_CONTAM: hypothetical protein FKN15_077282 [Acipenser sinensis]
MTTVKKRWIEANPKKSSIISPFCSSPATAPFKAQRHSQLALRFHQKVSSPDTAPFKAQHHSQLGLRFHQKDCSNVTAELQLLHTGASPTMVTTATPHRVTTGSANRKTTMTVAQAMTNGYGINTTPTRILVRAAYNSTESQPQVIQSVPMAVLRSTTFYKQRWMVMMVDTAVTCPTDGTAFTEQMITWNVPRVLPPLVPTPQITTLDVQMGVDGRKLDPATIHNRDYKLDVGPQLITVKIPVGADGGYYKSHVLDNTYVISYSIEPMLENTWQDGPEKTKYTVLHPITTPFMPRPPVVTNTRVFNVTLGTFLPDVELVRIIVGPETLTVPEANLKGYNVQEHVFPNGSKTYTLQVPFGDPNVKQKVTPPDTRTYILPLTYLLNIVPENTPFTHPAVVEAILKDIIPPTVTGYCDGAAFYTMVTYGNMGRNWVPFVGSRELGGSLLALYKYNANATNFWMTVPYNSVDATYEVISSLGIRSRLDLTLKDIGTMVVVADFSLSCSFPTKMIDCFTNGTMAALAVKVESVPSLSPSQLTLRDPSCRPLQSDATNAVFYFNVNSCGTTRRVISSSGIRSRLDLTLKDIGTMVVVADFSLSCSFPTKMIDCFTNGTMAALAVKVESVPSLSPSQLTLRDPSCRPLQSDAINAVFYFNVNSCGTTRRFDNNLLTYENEVLFTSYRLRVACHYLVNDTKVVQFLYQNNPAPVVQPGVGDLAVIMRLALDSTYNDFYGAQDYPVVKYLRRPLYFEVELLYSRDPQAELFLENCWATYSADRNSSPKWDVVVDSCENSADEYLTIFHPVSSNARVLFPSHLKRFEVKMFSFTSGQDALKGQADLSPSFGCQFQYSVSFMHIKADAAELEERERERMDAVAASSAERTTAEERGERDKMQIYEVKLEERERDRMDAVAGSSAERTTSEEREGETETETICRHLK